MSQSTKPKLLVIEDDDDLAEVIADYFRSEGYQVEVRADALGPLSRLRKIEGAIPPWEVVLTDLKIPGMDGIEFIHELKALAPVVPVILMTAHGSIEMAVKAVREGAYDFVTKPLKFAELAVTVSRALEHRRLVEDNVSLKAMIRDSAGASGIIAKSPAMKSVCDLVERVAASKATVLVNGESGTGKEVVARLIHELSPRKDKPFVAINCAAIPENLLESELFGFAKGAFTGAIEKKTGLFEEAEGGTLFLDEIGDLGAALQAKLLRVLQDRKIKRIGENNQRLIDVRIVAATHRNLTHEVAEGRFREDLFFRLNVIPIRLAPLRDRREDILPLAEHFLKRFKAANGSQVTGFSKPAIDELLRKAWRGNVRELENTVERAVVLSQGVEIEPHDLVVFSEMELGEHGNIPRRPPTAREGATEMLAEDSFLAIPQNASDDELPTLNDLGARYASWVVKRVGGVREKARRILDIDRKTLAKKLQGLGEGTQSDLDPMSPTSH